MSCGRLMTKQEKALIQTLRAEGILLRNIIKSVKRSTTTVNHAVEKQDANATRAKRGSRSKMFGTLRHGIFRKAPRSEHTARQLTYMYAKSADLCLAN